MTHDAIPEEGSVMRLHHAFIPTETDNAEENNIRVITMVVIVVTNASNQELKYLNMQMYKYTCI